MLYRAWQLKEALRSAGAARQLLDRWLAWACRSRIPAFVKLQKTIRAHKDGIPAAVGLGLSNSKLEGLNSKIRLTDHQRYGHHSAALSNKEIAERLSVSEATLKTHVNRVFAKAGLRGPVQAVILAYEAGLAGPGWDGRPPGPASS